MLVSLLQKIMPRGLYGRAALILFLPIAVLQFVVVVGFSQRYFSDVTRQLMTGVQAEVGLYVVGANGLSPDLLEPALIDLDSRLNFKSKIDDISPAAQTRRTWYDFSGLIIIDTLMKATPGIEGIDLLEDQRMVAISVATDAGRLHITFSRKRASAQNPHQVILITLITGALMSYVAASFLRNQLRPIRRLARAAQAFGRGDIVPYRVAGATEVRAAGNAFLLMRSKIERHIEQRTLILSGVSHDLRTPLTRMKLSLSLMESEGVEDDVRELKADVLEMERLLDEFLAFTRSEALDDFEEIAPSVLLRDAKRRAERRSGKHVDLQDGEGENLRISARPEALARALDNLLNNALRYGSAVSLSISAHERFVVFCVEDDGPGIAQADREKALQPFARLDAARNQNHGPSVGLGLAIATDIARKHGGNLKLGESSALGGLKAEIVVAR